MSVGAQREVANEGATNMTPRRFFTVTRVGIWGFGGVAERLLKGSVEGEIGSQILAVLCTPFFTSTPLELDSTET